MVELLQGEKQWVIKEKLSEGDAGEVYTAESKDSQFNDQVKAIVKRPKQNPVYAMRQATQIKLEGEILQPLKNIQLSVDGYSIQATQLLDVSYWNNTHPEEFFIVIEKAAGISLNSLYKIAQSGIRQNDLSGFSKADLIFAKRVAEKKRIPDLSSILFNSIGIV